MSARMLLHRFTRNRRLVAGLGIFAAVIALFGLIGYFWLPGYAKTKLETALSDALQRPVTVQSIDIQPYTLELTVRGFRIGEKETSIDAAKALFSLDELYVNLSIASIARGAPVISSVSLTAPAFRLVRESDQRFNITDLIEDFLKRPDEGGETNFSVSNILVEGGRFEFVDRLKKSHQEISGIRIGIPFIANFESDEKSWVEPYFSAKINDAPVELNGRLRPFTQNREATLELKLSNVDLTRIDEYSPVPTGIRLLSGYFDSDLLLTFAQADGQPPSIVLSGRTALRKLEIENKAVEAPYTAKLDQLDVKLTEINLNGAKPSRASLVLSEASVIPKEDSDPLLSLPKLSIDEIEVDTKRQAVTLGTVVLDRFKASARREPDGRLDLEKLFAQAPGATQAPKPSSAKAETDKPWSAQLGSFKLAGAILRFEDSTLKNLAPMVADPVDLTVSDIDLTGAAPLKLALKAAINQRGSLEANGALGWSPVTADLEINARDVDLVALQGWVGDRLNALLTRGAISFNGNIQANGSPLKVAVNGKGQFTNFNVVDKLSTTDLMRWRNLDIDGIEFVNDPLRVKIASIAIADFFAHVVLTPEGELNLKHIVREDDSGGAGVKTASANRSEAGQQAISATLTQAAAASAPQKKKPAPLPVHIGRVVMQGGNVNFHDQFIKPNYRARLTGLTGRVGPLDPRKPGEIDIRGAVDKTAPLKIVGKVDTLGSELFLDVTASAKGIDMPTFSPYSGKYVGYAIEKGKLSVDIHYHVEKGELTAENSIFLDQLTLGEKIESPDALSIPVNLALALLKNRRGEINVHLPVSGSINDPQFSLGGVIFDAIINLLTKAATAPLAVLGSLFGGEELSQITFLPGQAQLTPEAEKILETLSRALIDRPALELDITGWADALHDPEALKRSLLERRVKAQKLSEKVKKGEAVDSLRDVELSDEEYARYLTMAYKEAKFVKPKNVIGLTKSLPVPEMEQLMLANIDAGDNEMRQLAERRAQAARDWVIERGGVAGDRVFVLAPKIEAEADGEKSGSRVEFSLR
ncbi:DUF748 domain-containing protein [Nitrosospira briensis]|uniref:DUF748 domain-containing protein n=1 Tax=Nitrosospira briensis TaxID=35799 RepID=UPI0008F015B5|nr:DUF748 domain-containing protein [Nitrosospira briensis]SFO34702.1 protein of unknown function [Nitrosospira briensis]